LLSHLLLWQQTYLQTSPGFADVLAIWDKHHLNNAQKVCVPLLCLLADMLRHTPEDNAAAQGRHKQRLPLGLHECLTVSGTPSAYTSMFV
jgi:hypothetical protein